MVLDETLDFAPTCQYRTGDVSLCRNLFFGPREKIVAGIVVS
jgi:hypothetical protein